MKRISMAVLAIVFAALPMTARAQRPGPVVGRLASATAGGPEEKAVLFPHADIDTAWAAAQRSGRPMLIYVVSDNCFYCKKMLKETLWRPPIATGLAGSVESVAVNATEDAGLAKKLGVKAYPTTLVVSPSNQLLYQAIGFKTAEEFVAGLWPVLREGTAGRRMSPQDAAVAARTTTQAE